MLGTLGIYLLLAVYTSFFAWLTSLAKNKITMKILGFLTILIPTVVAAIRENVGTDYNNYVDIFNGIPIRDNLEIGFTTLVDVIKLFSDNVTILFFILQWLISYFILKTLLYYKKYINVGLGMFIFMMLFYLTGLNIMRQMAAVSIGLYAIRFIFEKNLFLFSLFILFGMSFHMSEIILLPFYFVYNTSIFRQNNKNIWILVIISVLLIFNMDIISVFIGNIIPIFAHQVGYFQKKSFFSLSIIGILKNLILVLPAIWIFVRYKIRDNIGIFFIMYICSIIFNLAGDLYVNSAVTRIALPLEVGIVVLLPFSISKVPKASKNIVSLMMITYIILLFIFNYFISGFSEVVPYKTIF